MNAYETLPRAKPDDGPDEPPDRQPGHEEEVRDRNEHRNGGGRPARQERAQCPSQAAAMPSGMTVMVARVGGAPKTVRRPEISTG
jgi:hypothetical protein